MYEKALAFATKKHEGQFRTDGVTPYIIHPTRIAARAQSEIHKVIALLHDTVEDTDTTIEEIEREFGSQVAKAVDCLTHRKSESYIQYIGRLKPNKDAAAIKLLDICDNLSDSPSENAKKKSLLGLTALLT